MMHLFESLFDVAYLLVVMALGIRLVLEKNKGAKKFGWMALLLGFGDAFHLIPRVIAHLTLDGFVKYSELLSWGQFVTSMTMTIFYVLLFQYYQSETKDRDKKKSVLLYSLVVLRIILVCLPQNGWGGTPNRLFDYLRNIPFSFIGGLMVYWTWPYRKTKALHQMSLYILVSFICYGVVVFFAKAIPALGAFMMPKTLAYIAIVVVGYRYFIGSFHKDHLIATATTNLIVGLIGGVFYREFTKVFSWNQATSLSVVHVHLIALGFLLILVLSLLQKERKVVIKTPVYIFQVGLYWTVVCFMIRGIYTITHFEQALFNESALSGMAGIGHILLSFGLVWWMIQLLPTQQESIYD